MGNTLKRKMVKIKWKYLNWPTIPRYYLNTPLELCQSHTQTHTPRPGVHSCRVSSSRHSHFINTGLHLFSIPNRHHTPRAPRKSTRTVCLRTIKGSKVVRWLCATSWIRGVSSFFNVHGGLLVIWLLTGALPDKPVDFCQQRIHCSFVNPVSWR